MMSFLSKTQLAPPIEVFAINEACAEDDNPHKLNLGVGAYRTNEGQPWVLPVVRSVEVLLASDEKLNKEYLPICGIEDMCSAASKLILGDDSVLIASKKADSCQALGGTGAVYLALQFLYRNINCTNVYISKPTWPNHRNISKLVGLQVNEYRYWDASTKAVDFSGMLDDLRKAPELSIVILHACAHNPTGMDLTHEQWMEVAEIVKMKKLFPLFDIAYQGFATGNLDNDAWAVRYFANQGFEMFVAQSFSKNFGLYNERVGNLLFISHDPETTHHVKSQLKTIVRQTWSNPPQHGARVVATVLNNPSLLAEWKTHVVSMSDRVKQMRQGLYERLRALGTPGTWDHIIKQIGMFSYSGLTKPQVDYIRSKHHIYLMNDGRINMCGLTTHNLDYVAKAIHDTVVNVKN